MLTHTKILGIIPARAGSRGVIDKHSRILGDRPLIAYTIESALKSRMLHTIALSSDCPKIIAIAQAFPRIEIPFVRPSYLAQDDTPTVPVIKHTLKYYQQTGHEFDFICLLQPTTPFRADGLIDQTIDHLLIREAQSLVTVRKIPSQYHPYWSFMLDACNQLSAATPSEAIIPLRQQLPDAYHRDGQIYLASVGLINADILLNTQTIGYHNEQGPNINIDTPTDWALAEKWISNGRKI
jgi:CMP-N,N'-diacetyllegionaminic acid synthase